MNTERFTAVIRGRSVVGQGRKRRRGESDPGFPVPTLEVSFVPRAVDSDKLLSVDVVVAFWGC